MGQLVGLILGLSAGFLLLAIWWNALGPVPSYDAPGFMVTFPLQLFVFRIGGFIAILVVTVGLCTAFMRMFGRAGQGNSGVRAQRWTRPRQVGRNYSMDANYEASHVREAEPAPEKVRCDVCTKLFKSAPNGRVKCDGCRGTGRTAPGLEGFFSLEKSIICRICGGKGHVRCPQCHGTRYM